MRLFKSNKLSIYSETLKYKIMITLKKLDFWGQITVTITIIICAIFLKGNTLFAFYFIVGGWQLISVLIHVFAKKMLKAESRQVYHVVLLLVLLFLIIGLFVTSIMWLLLYGLLFLSPLLAIWYLIICYTEIKVNQSRDLIHFR